MPRRGSRVRSPSRALVLRSQLNAGFFLFYTGNVPKYVIAWKFGRCPHNREEGHMANIEDYLLWRGDLTFEQDEFNLVDNLILAELAYVDFKDIIPAAGSGEKITLKQACDDFFELHDEEELKLVKSFIWYAPFFMKKMAHTKRFADMLLGNYALHNNEEKQVQFGAFTAEPGDGSIYVSFMGTDDSLIGWKEDFNMSFIRPIPSQLEAAEYVNETIKYSRRKIRLGGHSKGGNLAIYAAVKAKPSLKRRIIAVYNNDGPGFDREMIESEEYRQMLPKIKTIVPEHSVVGMLLEHEEKYMIVKSSQTGIMQHDAMSWQVCGNRFETVKSVDRTSRMLNEALSNWINGLSRTQRSEFVETLFAIITSSGAVNLSDLSADRFNFAGSALKMYSSLDRETKIMLRRMLKSLTGEFDKARKMINNKFK